MDVRTSDVAHGARRGTAGQDAAAREAAVMAARIADEMRAGDITVLYVEKQITVTDYFVIASGRNKRQIQQIAREVRDHLKKEVGYTHVHIEGLEGASWVLIDAGPVIVHVFREDLRKYYDLELLWGDAPTVEWRENL